MKSSVHEITAPSRKLGLYISYVVDISVSILLNLIALRCCYVAEETHQPEQSVPTHNHPAYFIFSLIIISLEATKFILQQFVERN